MYTKSPKSSLCSSVKGHRWKHRQPLGEICLHTVIARTFVHEMILHIQQMLKFWKLLWDVSSRRIQRTWWICLCVLSRCKRKGTHTDERFLEIGWLATAGKIALWLLSCLMCRNNKSERKAYWMFMKHRHLSCPVIYVLREIYASSKCSEVILIDQSSCLLCPFDYRTQPFILNFNNDQRHSSACRIMTRFSLKDAFFSV